MKRARTCIALLRGINVGRSTRIPMMELRTLCEEIGWRDVRTYIQSGNVIFQSGKDASQLEVELEAALPGTFGVTASVIVVTADALAEHARANPFPEESAATPQHVMLALSKAPPADDALDRLRERAGTERLERVDDALWIHYPDGAGRSRLTPGMFDRAVGSPVTTRNWRTVEKLTELSGG